VIILRFIRHSRQHVEHNLMKPPICRFGPAHANFCIHILHTRNLKNTNIPRLLCLWMAWLHKSHVCQCTSHIFIEHMGMFRCQHRHAVIKDVNWYRCKLKQASSILPQFCAHFWRFMDTCQEIYFQV